MLGILRVTDKEFVKFQNYIEKNIGIKFPDSKKSLLESRLSSYLQKNKYESYGQYLDFIEKEPENSKEIEFLVDKLTTHTTSFFRENYHFEYLIEKGIDLLKTNFGNITFKILSLGASTGEEMYSLAMVMEDLKNKKLINNYILDAADISKYALLKAKEGVFKIDHLAAVPDRYRHYFDIKDNQIIVKDQLKENLRFFILNLVNEKQVFPDKYHIVFCRNTLIYFSKEFQQIAVNNIARILLNNGLYFMGHSESLHGLVNNFIRLEATIYTKTNEGNQNDKCTGY